jgi:hypothetical protein
MRWYNAQRDELPVDSETVLLSVNGIYYITVYDAGERIFRLRDQIGTYFKPGEDLIYWTHFESPDEDN